MDSSAGELVVAFHPDATAGARAIVADRMSSGGLEGLSLRPLSSHAALALERVERAGESGRQRAIRVEKARYFSSTTEGRSIESALDELRSLPGVETAYWKPGVENPLAPAAPPDIPEVEMPGVRPSDFRILQTYLDAAPQGVDVGAASLRPGGRGDGVRVVDIEGGWRFTHTDLLVNSGGLLAGTQYPEVSWRDHGTAVLGELGGDADSAGVCGICPNAILSSVSHRGLGSSKAIEIATGLLSAGDVLLLEMHRPGPRFAYAQRLDQLGYIAVEWWPDDLLAIQGAIAKGIAVVEAAGNGAEDLDAPLYNTPGPNFPAAWCNPLSGGVDSGAIVVGAGAPPSGAYGPDRSRLDFSNWGRRVDCQGWGRGVLTTGYGDFYTDIQDAADEDYWYTRQFSGTSSASPIVAGVVACLQGVARAGHSVLQSSDLRSALRATGSLQVARPGAPEIQNIGSRPDLAALIRHLGL